MLALQGDAEAHGAAVAFRSPLERGRVRDNGIMLEVGGAEPMQVLARAVVNSGGLHAQRIAASIQGFPPARVPPTYYAKGNYYSLVGRSPFSRLVYPMPNEAGLGVHITIDLGGQARFGPDVEWIERIDYDVDPRRSDSFYAAIREYWPALRDGQLAPGYAGIRPKIVGPEAKAADFVVQGPRDHGVPGLVNLFGIESPGLTAALAIADYARDLVAASPA
jgi:L-2-hydroxyglutarate oxidase LhgO